MHVDGVDRRAVRVRKVPVRIALEDRGALERELRERAGRALRRKTKAGRVASTGAGTAAWGLCVVRKHIRVEVGLGQDGFDVHYGG